MSHGQSPVPGQLGELPADPAAPTLRIQGLVKRFAGTTALGGLDFEAYPGEVHALLGANGAGKSTLIKILAGIYSPDQGTIEVSGVPFSRADAAGRIAFIHQDLGLVDQLTVAENIAVVGGFARRRGLIDRAATRRRAAAALQVIESRIDPRAPVAELSRADKSMIAIARALVGQKDLIFLDEPTASLHETEVAHLFHAVGLLRSGGAAIVYVTHRIDEVFRLSDRVTVLRDGLRVFTGPTATSNAAALIASITGQRATQARPASRTPGTVALRADRLIVQSGASASLAVRRGEIVGMAGLQGAGQADIGRALCGLAGLAAGEIRIHDRTVHIGSAADAIAHGVVFVTSNREVEGVAYDMTVQENLYLNPGALGAPALKLRSRRQERSAARHALGRFRVVPPEPGVLISTLSGGNQQKAILARCLSLASEVIVLEEPTMGVDVGGKADLYALLRQAAADGKAVLVISTDFEELETLCDRVLVFDRGAVVTELDRDHITVPALTRAASGGDHD